MFTFDQTGMAVAHTERLRAEAHHERQARIVLQDRPRRFRRTTRTSTV